MNKNAFHCNFHLCVMLPSMRTLRCSGLLTGRGRLPRGAVSAHRKSICSGAVSAQGGCLPGGVHQTPGQNDRRL